MPHATLSLLPLDPRALEARVAHPGAGAILTFQGVARDNFEGRSVCALEYDAYPELALPELEAIAAEVVQRWPGVRVAIEHRVGRLEIGDIAVVVAVSAPHRGAAYAANRYAIDQLKGRVPIWKKEHYPEGGAWKANAESHGGPGEHADSPLGAAIPATRQDA